MADVGDRIVVGTKGQSRSGVVTAVGRALITVRWDSGAETSIVPGPGVLSVAPTTDVSAAGEEKPRKKLKDSAPAKAKEAKAKKAKDKKGGKGKKSR